MEGLGSSEESLGEFVECLDSDRERRSNPDAQVIDRPVDKK